MPKSRKTQKPLIHLLASKDFRKIGIAALAVLVMLDLAAAHHGYFTFDGTLGFAAWFGALACFALLLLALAVGSLLRRPEATYDN